MPKAKALMRNIHGMLKKHKWRCDWITVSKTDSYQTDNGQGAKRTVTRLTMDNLTGSRVYSALRASRA